jgi:hypothetical protein
MKRRHVTRSRPSPELGFRFALFICLAALTARAEAVQLPASEYQDRLRGGWGGQILGSAMADRTKSGKLAPEEISNAATQSFLNLQFTFLSALERHRDGLSRPQAAALLRVTEFPLSHASLAARENLRRGMLPKFSGHPRFNTHSDDHDFQSAAAVLGLVSSGSPRRAAELADLFGGILSYGDGQYAGRFFAAAYAQAFLEKEAKPASLERCLRAGLTAIHPQSAYAAAVHAVFQEFGSDPRGWRKARAALWKQWGVNDLCPQGAHEEQNFDAKLNGGFILIALLYGGGDFARTMEIAAGCGQQIRENAGGGKLEFAYETA